jgi:hypothetical protein
MIEKIKNHLLNGVLLLVLFSSCKKEVSLEIQQESQSNLNELKSLVSQVKLWHDSTVSSSLKTKAQNGVRAFSVNENDIVPPIVDWEKAFINFDSSTVKSITVPISMNYKTGEHMQLVATKSKNKINGYYIKVTSDSSYYVNQNDIFNYTDYSGSISVYNLMGVRIKKQDFKLGIVSNSNNSSKTTLSNNTTYATFIEREIDITIIDKKSRGFSAQFYGLIYIDYQQNIQTDEFGGGGDVIAGGEEEYEYEDEGEDYDDGTEQKSDGRNTSIPNEIVLSNGNIVKINFNNTKDGVSSNQQINIRTLECLKSALEIINASSQKIKSILITATTNGHPYFKKDGTPKFSDHHSGAAIDIGQINNRSIKGVSDLTLSFQSALNTNPNIRENFGPGSGNSYKFGKTINDIPGHNTHLHFSIIIPQ